MPIREHIGVLSTPRLRFEVAASLARAALLIAGLLTLSCSANRMYRPIGLEEYPGYSLAFIEFDDQGELWAPSQLDQTLAYLEKLNRNEAGVALAIFVHGWNANASARQETDPESALSRYKTMLARLRDGIREEFPDRELPVMGVFVGWRGHVSSVPFLRQASFYNRQGAAERIAGASATESIYRIITTLRDNPASRSVLIGHSFGSIILERALAQAVIGALLASPDQELIFPADLVVLLNPAGSANRTKQLVDILARNRLKTYRFDENGNRFERPLLVSFSSETDTATRLFFPAGMRLKAATKKFRDYGEGYCSPISNQRRLYTHTAGNLPELHSHEVTAGPRTNRQRATPPQGRLVPEFLHYEEEYDPLTQQQAISFDGVAHRFTIKRKPLALNDTPYWIMQVPRELIPDHTTVLTEDTFRLIEAVLTLSATYDADATTVIEREDGVRPVAIVPRPDGSALVVDRGRGVYAVGRDSGRPVFLSCLPNSVDPDTAIGFHVAGHLAYAILMSRQSSSGADRCRTELLEFEIGSAGYKQLPGKHLVGSECYSAATVDLIEKRVLLGLDTEEGPQLWAADLTSRTPRPHQFLDLSGEQAPTALLFEGSRQRLFTAQAEDGRLTEIDLSAEKPVTRLLTSSAGWPLALAYSRPRQSLYVTDAKERTIWSLDCSDRCGEPSVFLQSEQLENPTTLAVALDGTLWLGDRHGQTLRAIRQDGSVETTIRSLSGDPSYEIQR
jgi:hypothetical protein